MRVPIDHSVTQAAASLEELRDGVARLSAADRRVLRLWLVREYGVDGNAAQYASRKAPHEPRNT